MIDKTNQALATLQKYLDQSFEQSRSKAGRWLEYRIMEAEQGRVAIRFTVQDQHTNPQKRLHGGVISLIMDEVLGLANYSLGLEHFYTTASLNVNFLYGANLGEELIAHARVIRCGKKLSYIEGHIVNAENIEIARANTSLINTGTRIFDIDAE